MPTAIPNINAEKIQGNLSINSVSATTYYNLPPYLYLSGGTVSGNTIFQSGLTANTISATTYYNLPNTLYTGDGTLLNNRIVNLSSNTLNFSSSTYPDNLVLSGGNVGIGTSTPQYKIDLSGTGILSRFGSTSNGYWYFKSNQVSGNRLEFVSYGDLNFDSQYGTVIENNTYDTRILGGYYQNYISFGRPTPGFTEHQRQVTLFLPTGNFGINVNTGDTGYRFTSLGSGLSGSANIDNTLYVSSGSNVGIGIYLPSNKIHVSATTNPVRIEGLTADTSDLKFVSVDSSGVLHTYPISGFTGTTSSSSTGQYLPLSGGTVTGGTIFTQGVTANTLSNIDYIDFDLVSGASVTASVSRLRYDSGEGGLVTTLLGGNVDLKIGQQNVVLCYNGESNTLNKGEVVHITGNQGNRPKILRAVASAETESSNTLGLVAETIISGSEGFVTTFGNIKNFKITGITPGSYVYLSPTVPGQFTGTQPQAPEHIVALGYVVRTGNTQGEIFVNINNGWELNELHNVRVTSPQNGDILQYSAGTYPVWVNTSYPVLSGLSATTISATTYQNIPSQSGTGVSTFSYVPSTGILTITKNDTTTLTAGTFSYVTATTLSAANVLSVTSNGGSPSTLTIDAVTGGSYSNGTITLSGTGTVNGTQITGLATASFTWSAITASQSAVVNYGFICNSGSLITVTLPSTAAVGSIIEITGIGAGGWKVAQNASQAIHFGITNSTTGTGGYIQSTQTYDSVRLLCTTANTDFTVLSSVGNITII